MPGAPRKFSVADDIEFATFVETFAGNSVFWSPAGDLFAVQVERGLLAKNRVEDELRIYSAEALRKLDQSQPPQPVWAMRESTLMEGPIIESLQWLQNSSGLAFLERSSNGKRQLRLLDLSERKVETLTPETQDVISFTIRDRTHFAYSVRDAAIFQKAAAEREKLSLVLTGRVLRELLFPLDQDPSRAFLVDRGELWAARGGAAFQIRNAENNAPVVVFTEGWYDLRLSPDGNWLTTALPFAEIPREWETLYLSSHGRFRGSATQDLQASYGNGFASRFVSIQLETGKVFELTGTPTGIYGEWYGEGQPDWSADGRTLLLPGAYLPQHKGSPCLVTVNPQGGSVECVAPLGSLRVKEVRFDGSRSDRILVKYQGRKTEAAYVRSSTGGWDLAGETAAHSAGLSLTIQQSLNHPPALVATAATPHSIPVWDPNPQLKEVQLGDASAFRWQDRQGRSWSGALYKPPDFVPGRRYPLVIQTNGFQEDKFIPSGGYTSAYAARALAGAGMVVLVTPGCPMLNGPGLGACVVEIYESAVQKLVSDRIADSDRIGIIGFSRSCYYVLKAITTSALHFKAASITDGINAGYFQYVYSGDDGDGAMRRDEESLNGGKPFGEGLQQWLRNSPEFNLDRVNAPVQVVATGPRSVLTMWEPYSMLKELGKPVDFIFINSSGHPLTNPAARLVSQGGSVEWFRFWLLDEKDQGAAKAEQYRRWEALRTVNNERPHLK